MHAHQTDYVILSRKHASWEESNHIRCNLTPQINAYETICTPRSHATSEFSYGAKSKGVMLVCDGLGRYNHALDYECRHYDDYAIATIRRHLSLYG